MATSINWVTGEITVPKADTTLVTLTPYEIRELNVDQWRLELRDLEDDPDGRPWPTTHNHSTDEILSGIIYAPKVTIVNGYTVTFEDGLYAVNLVGANNNILDVNNKNQVSVNPSNSAGLQVYNVGSGVTEQDKLDIAAEVWKVLLATLTTNDSAGKAFRDFIRINSLIVGEDVDHKAAKTGEDGHIKVGADIDIKLTGDGDENVTATRQ